VPNPAEPDPLDKTVRADDASTASPTAGARSSEARAPARRWALILGVASGVLLVDQLSKWWAVHTLSSRTIAVVWTLRFNLTGNTGASFSRFGGQGPLISLGAVAVVCAVLWLSPAVSSRLGSVALGMILGGALGNLMDRAFRGDAGVLHGPVVDFIDFQWWPVFNVADMGVVIGALLLAISFLRAPAGSGSSPASGSAPADG